MTALAPAACTECGRSLIHQSRPCGTCSHGEFGHDIGKDGQRTRCLSFGPGGRCPCERFEPAEATP